MEASTALALALPFGLAMTAFGSAVSLAKAISAAMEAMGRQPEVADKIQTAMIIGSAFIEALTIYAFVSVFLLSGKI